MTGSGGEKARVKNVQNLHKRAKIRDLNADLFQQTVGNVKKYDLGAF